VIDNRIYTKGIYKRTMAAAALPVAKVVVTQVLPILYDGYQKRAKIIETAKRCEASMHKAEELLNAPSASNSTEPAVRAAVESLSKCVEEMHQYLTKMTQNMPKSQEKEDGTGGANVGSSMLGGMVNGAKRAVNSAIEVGRGTLDALMGEHESKLNELNQALLLASVDLGLAISRLPPPKPKSAVCVVQ
jgi:hypothetical protein